MSIIRAITINYMFLFYFYGYFKKISKITGGPIVVILQHFLFNTFK